MVRKSLKLLCVILIAFVLLAGIPAASAAGNITINGYVTDKNNYKVGGANITIGNSTGVVGNATTDAAAGYYTYSGLYPGNYSVKADKSGYNWTVYTGNISANFTQNVSIPGFTASPANATAVPATNTTVTPGPATATPTAPTASAKPAPGFEVILALTGLVVVCYMLRRNR